MNLEAMIDKAFDDKDFEMAQILRYHFYAGSDDETVRAAIRTVQTGKIWTVKRRPAPRGKADITIGFEYDDGGREDAGYKGTAGDCVVRAFCILTGVGYGEAYKQFAYAQSVLGEEPRRSARNGIDKRAMESVFRQHGIVRKKQGRVKATWSEAYATHGDCIVKTTGHVCAIVDGAVRDTHDERGYWWDPIWKQQVGTDFDAPPNGLIRIDGEQKRLRDVCEWRERKALSIWVMNR